MKEKRENKKLKKLENKEKYQSKLERREIQTYIDNVLWVKWWNNPTRIEYRWKNLDIHTIDRDVLFILFFIEGNSGKHSDILAVPLIGIP